MILKKHQIEVPLHNDVGRVEYAIIYDVIGLSYPLVEISPQQMEMLQKRDRALLAQPLYWTQVENKLIVHPRPDKDYERFRVRYLPQPRFLGEEDPPGPSETQFAPTGGTTR